MGSFREMRITRKRFPAITNRANGRSYRLRSTPGSAPRHPAFGTTLERFEDDFDVPHEPIAHVLLADHDHNVEPGRTTICLGSLEVAPAARSIFIDGVAVELGGRAFDLLMVLLDAKGGIVSKEHLLSQVWPTVTVVESNLKVQLSLLRRALGAERWRVKTISGRGYLFVADDAQTANVAAAPKGVASSSDKQLVIVVDADVSTQEMIVRALSDVAKYFTGATRLALVSRDTSEPAFAF